MTHILSGTGNFRGYLHKIDETRQRAVTVCPVRVSVILQSVPSLPVAGQPEKTSDPKSLVASLLCGVESWNRVELVIEARWPQD